MFGFVSRVRKGLERLDKDGDICADLGRDVRVVFTNVSEEGDATDHDSVVAVREQGFRAVEEVGLKVGDFADDAHGTERGFSSDVRV